MGETDRSIQPPNQNSCFTDFLVAGVSGGPNGKRNQPVTIGANVFIDYARKAFLDAISDVAML
eukprot:3661783-Amphidinium_carterae.1